MAWVARAGYVSSATFSPVVDDRMEPLGRSSPSLVSASVHLIERRLRILPAGEDVWTEAASSGLFDSERRYRAVEYGSAVDGTGEAWPVTEIAVPRI